ncbi:MAG: heparan-alpha-glucosaminide N-acetyltransferase domain-containing protein [Ferruginibacter sp.]
MQSSLHTNSRRIESIDILRGIVMVIMALDHVREYTHSEGLGDPLDLATTTPLLYFTRWITHFCAPVFVFLSGTSVYLQSLRKTKKELASFLIKRGCWLIFAEMAIITLGWSFNPLYNLFFLQVIWAIGISMVILGLLIRLPLAVILTIGLAIVLGHNLLDIPESAPGFRAGFVWDLLHHGMFSLYPYGTNRFFIIVYPFVPWTGLMLLGYCMGTLFAPTFPAEKRRIILAFTGAGLLLLFIMLRFINIYGDPHPWSTQKNSLFTFFSFMKVHKYPPSLLYMFATIGPALILLSLIENIQNRFTNIVRVYGRVAFFYYILHIYLIHMITTICFFARGHSMGDAMSIAIEKQVPFLFVVPGEGFGLGGVYLVWILVVVALYPLCKWYDKYKTNHKEKWWLSYL